MFLRTSKARLPPSLARPKGTCSMATPGKLAHQRDLGLDDLWQAIHLYMNLAYPEGKWPEPVARRLNFAKAGSLLQILNQRPFEKSPNMAPGNGPIFSLRLGNHFYPCMKLQIQPWPNPSKYLLSVNAHDQISSLEPCGADSEAFRALQCRNQKLKEAIEHAWAEAGLPTFVRFLRNYLAASPCMPEPDAARGPGTPSGTG